jgi:hypothetical protein
MFELIYSSIAITALDDEELEALLGRSRHHNEVNSITGLLLHVHTESDRSAFFVQLLEGPQAPVEQTYERITTDVLHHDLRVLSRGASGGRKFGDWSMRLEQISTTHLQQPPHRIVELVRDSYTVEKLILRYANDRHRKASDVGPGRP